MSICSSVNKFKVFVGGDICFGDDDTRHHNSTRYVDHTSYRNPPALPSVMSDTGNEKGRGAAAAAASAAVSASSATIEDEVAPHVVSSLLCY